MGGSRAGGRTPLPRSALGERRCHRSGSAAAEEAPAPEQQRLRLPPFSDRKLRSNTLISSRLPSQLPARAATASRRHPSRRFAGGPGRRRRGGGRPAGGPDWRSRRTWGRPLGSALAARPPPRGTAGQGGERTGLRSARVSAHRARRCGEQGTRRSRAEPAERWAWGRQAPRCGSRWPWGGQGRCAHRLPRWIAAPAPLGLPAARRPRERGSEFAINSAVASSAPHGAGTSWAPRGCRPEAGGSAPRGRRRSGGRGRPEPRSSAERRLRRGWGAAGGAPGSAALQPSEAAGAKGPGPAATPGAGGFALTPAPKSALPGATGAARRWSVPVDHPREVLPW